MKNRYIIMEYDFSEDMVVYICCKCETRFGISKLVLEDRKISPEDILRFLINTHLPCKKDIPLGINNLELEGISNELFRP